MIYDREYDPEGYAYDNSIDIVASGRSRTDRDYLEFEQHRKRAWVWIDRLFPDPHEGFQILKRAGIRVLSPKHKQLLSQQIANITVFPLIEIIERRGWDGPFIGYPDGTVISPDARTPPIAYSPGTVCVNARGTAAEWTQQVAAFIQQQCLPLFCIMISFAAPLLRMTGIQGNFGFMLSGPPRKGKTTCIDVAASVCGPALDSSDGRYYLKFNNTMNRIEQWLPHYSDLPFIIDELSSHGTKSSRMNDFRTLVHYLAGVDQKGRFDDDLLPASQTRTIILITSNDGMDELLQLESPDAAEAVADRLIELPVPRDEDGVFNARPDGYATAHAFAEAVRERVSRFHGAAMPEYLRQLVRHRFDDEANLIGGIQRRMAQFGSFPEVREAGGVSSRILDAVGLVYAGGELAKRYGVLPADTDCGAAAIHCLQLHLGFRAASDPVQRLLAWLRVSDVIDLRGRDRPSLSRDELGRRGAFIGMCRDQAQLWIWPAMFENSFADAASLLRRLKKRKVLKREGSGADAHLSIKCAIRQEKNADRVYVFMIPGLAEWLEANGRPRPKSRRP